MGIRSFITVAQLSAAKKSAPLLRLRMKKAATIEKSEQACRSCQGSGKISVNKVRVGVEPTRVGPSPKTTHCNTCGGTGKASYAKSGTYVYKKGGDNDNLATDLNADKPGGSGNIGYTLPCHRCGKGFPKYGQGAPHEQMVRLASPKGAPIHVGCRRGPSTNPAAVSQVKDARANKMGNLDKSGPEVVHECPHCGELASKGCEHSVKAHADQTDILGEK